MKLRECAFCLDEIDFDFNSTDDNENFIDCENVSYYGIIKLNCNHCYHNKCFFNYCSFLIYEKDIKCPLCRISLNKELLYNIKKYETILSHLITFLCEMKIKIYTQILFTKIKLDFKKIFNYTVYSFETYEHNKLNNIYKKINMIRKELKIEYEQLKTFNVK